MCCNFSINIFVMKKSIISNNSDLTWFLVETTKWCLSVYRCNNVLYIRGVEEEEEDGEMRE